MYFRQYYEQSFRAVRVRRETYGTRFTCYSKNALDEVLDQRVERIEHQLAHKVKDPNGTAYNRTKFLESRREMMQKWADYLESFLEGRDGVSVVPQKDLSLS